jgi:hypothetical protein
MICTLFVSDIVPTYTFHPRLRIILIIVQHICKEKRSIDNLFLKVLIFGRMV